MDFPVPSSLPWANPGIFGKIFSIVPKTVDGMVTLTVMQQRGPNCSCPCRRNLFSFHVGKIFPIQIDFFLPNLAKFWVKLEILQKMSLQQTRFLRRGRLSIFELPIYCFSDEKSKFSGLKYEVSNSVFNSVFDLYHSVSSQTYPIARNRKKTRLQVEHVQYIGS